MKRFLIPFLLALLTIFALYARTASLSNTPKELHRDELSIAYSGYSVLKTGYDEHGAGPYPFFFESFGDYKLPGLVYLTAFFIQIFGFTPFAARIGTALLGTLLVPISYLFVKELFNSKKLAIITSVLITFSVWHTFLSRTAYEPIASLTLFVLGLTFLLKARKKWFYFFFAAIALGLSYLFYNVALLLSPPLFLSLILIFRSEYFKNGKLQTRVGFCILFLLVIGIYMLMSTVTTGKLEATIIDPTKYANSYNDYYFLLLQTPVEQHRIRQIIATPLYEFSTDFINGYLAAFNPVYLFVKGGSNGWHSLSNIGFGNLSWFILPLTVYGAYSAVTGSLKSKKTVLFLVSYLLLSPIPDALTIDAPVTNRLLDFHFVITIFAAIGIFTLWTSEKKKIVLSLLIAGFSASYVLFFARYFFIHQWNLDPLWLPGYRKVAQRVHELESKYDYIFIDPNGTSNRNRTIDSPYIFQAFYSQVEPADFQKSVVWVDSIGYKKVASFGKYYYDFAQVPLVADSSTKTGLLVSRNKDFARDYLVIESNEGEIGSDTWYFFDLDH